MLREFLKKNPSKNNIIGKNIVKGVTQVTGHSLKLHFHMFEKS
jgi:hypothetical protein